MRDSIKGFPEIDEGGVGRLARARAPLQCLHQGADLPHALLTGAEAGLLRADSATRKCSFGDASSDDAGGQLKGNVAERHATVVVHVVLLAPCLRDGNNGGTANRSRQRLGGK